MKRFLEKEMSIQQFDQVTLSKSEKSGTVRSRKATEAESTLLNTNMEISIPGFLQLDAQRQFRIEAPLGSGGSATVFKAIILDSDLAAQHNTKLVAVKKSYPEPQDLTTRK
jgi:hypothetical protein